MSLVFAKIVDFYTIYTAIIILTEDECIKNACFLSNI